MIIVIGVETLLLLIVALRLFFKNFRKVRNWFFSLCSYKQWPKISKKLIPLDCQQIMTLWHSRAVKDGIENLLKEIALVFGENSMHMWTAEKYGFTFVYGLDEKDEIYVARNDLVIYSSKEKLFTIRFIRNKSYKYIKNARKNKKKNYFYLLDCMGSRKIVSLYYKVTGRVVELGWFRYYTSFGQEQIFYIGLQSIDKGYFEVVVDWRKGFIDLGDSVSFNGKVEIIQDSTGKKLKRLYKVYMCGMPKTA